MFIGPRAPRDVALAYDRAFADGKRNGALKSILSSLQRLRDEMADEIDRIAMRLGK